MWREGVEWEGEGEGEGSGFVVVMGVVSGSGHGCVVVEKMDLVRLGWAAAEGFRVGV